MGQARESPDSGYQPTEFYTNSYGAGASTFSQDPPLPATWEPPGPCLRVFHDFCAPAGKSGLPRGAGTRLRPFSLSHFVPPFLLPLPPFLFSFASPLLPPPHLLPLPPDRPSPSALFPRCGAPSPLPTAFLLPLSARGPLSANQRAAARGPAPRWFRAGLAEPRPRVRRAAPRGGGRWGLAGGGRGRGARRDAGVRGCEGEAGAAACPAWASPGLAGQSRRGERRGARPAARAARPGAEVEVGAEEGAEPRRWVERRGGRRLGRSGRAERRACPELGGGGGSGA